MKAVKHFQIDCDTFAGSTKSLPADKRPVDLVEVEDLSDKVPHVAYGGASKSRYTSPNDGQPVFVLEQNGMYSADAYVNDVWLFREDFTADQAAEFLRRNGQAVR